MYYLVAAKTRIEANSAKHAENIVFNAISRLPEVEDTPEVDAETDDDQKASTKLRINLADE